MTIPKLVFIFGIVVLFLGTAHETSVTGKDEFWVTLRTPMEMMERDSYWTLWLNDEVRLQKPPLIYWIIAGLYHVFGIELWAARLVGVFSGAGMAALTVLLYRRLFGGSGFLAGIVLLSTAGVVVEGRRAMLDLPLGFFTTLSVYLCLVAWQDRKRWAWAAAGAALAAATMAKGPQSLLFLLPALAMAWLLLPSRPKVRDLWIPGALLFGAFLLLALPWPLSMRVLHADFIEELNTQIVDQRLNKMNPLSPLEALGSLLLLTFPWFPAVVAGMALAWKKDHPLRDRRVMWLVGWIGLSLLPFFFMRSFSRYMVPVLPAASVLAMVTLERVGARARHGMMIASCILLAVLALVFALFGMWFRLTLFSSMFVVCMTLWMLWAAFTEERPDRPIIAAAWVYALVLGFVYPGLGVNRIPDDLPWEDFQQARVGIYSSYSQPAMMSVRLGRSVEWPFRDRPGDGPFDGFVFTTHDQVGEPGEAYTLVNALTAAGVPFAEAGRYPVLFSRRTWIRFTDPSVGWEEWREAFRTRNLRGLKSEVVWFRTGSWAEMD